MGFRILIRTVIRKCRGECPHTCHMGALTEGSGQKLPEYPLPPGGYQPAFMPAANKSA